jgi:hypothetical protein
MTQSTVPQTLHRLQVRTTDDPLFETVARLVNPPTEEVDKSVFLPAYAGFNIGTGADVDISYFGATPSDRPWATPRRRFDRHLRTDELWVVTEGDFYVPMAACRRPNDPEDLPRAQDMLCFFVKRGDLFVVRPNVWHAGPWAAQPGMAVRFFMLLSGHRKADSGSNVDHIVRDFEGESAIVPDVDASGQPR